MRVGRKRLLNWAKEEEILDELNQICKGWAHFREEIEVNVSIEVTKVGAKKLSCKLLEEYFKVSEMITKLHETVGQRMDRVQG